MAKRVLVAVADGGARATLRDALAGEGYLVAEAATGGETLAVTRSPVPDALIVDARLPDLTSADLCAALRQATTAPILVLGGDDDQAAQIRCLRAGADVWVARPFSVREVAARVLALIRRVELGDGRPAGVEVEHVGDFRLDRPARTVHIAGREVELTLKEFDLLSFLLAHSGRVQSRERILEQVWGNALGDRRTVNVHVRWLREKLSRFENVPFHITTVTRAGYRLDRLPDRLAPSPPPRRLRRAVGPAVPAPRL
jgi:DNA-binding response OmpR family regulator